MEFALQALRIVMRVGAGAGVFLAFGWPFLVSADPANAAFRVVATTTVVAFLLALAGILALKALALHRGGSKGDA